MKKSHITNLPQVTAKYISFKLSNNKVSNNIWLSNAILLCSSITKWEAPLKAGKQFIYD